MKITTVDHTHFDKGVRAGRATMLWLARQALCTSCEGTKNLHNFEQLFGLLSTSDLLDLLVIGNNPGFGHAAYQDG